ncbi:MAG: PepSY domain-containing protein, partial [Oscillospiraceae bacterium]|nr:PepSY domain-containing protein [Oscillospiraceae bacterium]
VSVYELKFWADSYEYDYEINAVTGAVLKSEKEYHGAPSRSGSASNSTQGSSTQATTQTTTTQITSENAKQVALNHAGVKSGDIVGFRSELDRDDGVTIYELTFRAGGYEYDYEINASTGAILKSDKELDD